MISFKKDILFQFRTFNLVVINYHVLSETLHGKIVPIIFLFNKEYFSEGASSDNFDEMEALQIDSCISLFRIDSARSLAHERGVHVVS
jgi:hypothetical protein